ncbi:16S rRNA (cytosine(1402)-N(4))-methyltransferase RsmH [Ktedonospora formicarum]|uniref:Ribosomal RNA small subunit methyltransferase H n=1 Tax=Ktedonospora formicarum TaxID=2778364 RepID=A0A8J3HZZ0_9CHLR|nr:16S rRNA (cytosine(1402)-N(4))-methyltransferase RsmH [Ktedonospora formicarum]GHO43732.1 ribosomal RNA small subunit methyltransferase H [Ktedonospora formicarum]
MNREQTQHIPVMLDAVMEYLRPTPGGHYIDGTLGGGGHTSELLRLSAPDGCVLGIDTDSRAQERVKARLREEIAQGRLVLSHGNFADMERLAREANFTGVEGILLDLGFSSDQMDDPQRGFAFSADGPLDMRLNQDLAINATDIVNSASEEELADIFWRYGEERRSRLIARRIVREREKQAITHTGQLASIAAAGVPYKHGAIHPATRVFQALRIAVNQELERLEAVLPQMLALLQAGGKQGRLAIISFHSLEDRIVKAFLKREATDCICPPRMPVCVCGHKASLRILTSKPVFPTEQEIASNPRARSARLRAAQVLTE